MDTAQINVEKLQTIYKALPDGSINKIAKMVKMHRHSVRRVLRGESYNAKIVDAALKIYEKEKARIDAQNSKIDSILSE